MGFESIAASTISCLNIIFGSSWLFVVIVEDITKDTVRFNNDVEAPNQSDCAKSMKDLCVVIGHYSDAKRQVFRQILLSF